MVQLWRHWEGKVTLVTLDHRGVGRSERLSCGSVDAEAPGSIGGVDVSGDEVRACVEEYEHELGTGSFAWAFTLDNAARDLHAIVEQMRDEDGYDKVMLYGVSYGSLWAQRLGMLYPGSVDGVLLDSALTMAGPPGRLFTYDLLGAGINEVALDFVDKCKHDSFCKAKLGSDPRRTFTHLFTRLFRDGHCAEGLDAMGIASREQLAQLFGRFMHQPKTRQQVTAFTHRLDRCDLDDVAALKYMATAWRQASHRASPGLASPVLKFNIMSSELFDLRRSEQDVDGDSTGQYAAASVGTWRSVAMEWARYPRDMDTFNRTLLDATTPYLILAGTLGSSTAFSRHSYEDLHGRVGALAMVTFPGSGDFVLQDSPMRDTHATGMHCAMLVLSSFVKSDGATVDQACLQHMTPVDFRGSGAQNKALFGLEDVYEGKAPASNVPVPIDSATEEEGDDSVALWTFNTVTATLSFALILCVVWIVRLRAQVKSLELEPLDEHVRLSRGADYELMDIYEGYE